jgi:acetyl esterase
VTLHPQAEAIVAAVRAAPAPVLDDDHLDEVRGGLAALTALGAGEPPVLHEVRDVVVPCPGGDRPARLYAPSDAPALPLLVWVHGGGWVLGGIDVADPIARQLAVAGACRVLSLDYRLAPEHPFPAGLDDVWHGLQWAAAHAADLGADPARVAVGGDSAGGNLAAVAALLARDAGAPRLALQVLVYPVTDHDHDTSSYREHGATCLLSAAHMRWFHDCYTRGGTDPADWRISPLRARDLSGVAPAFVVLAEHDVLHDEGDAYARALAAAGVAVEVRRYDGQIHVFFGLPALFDAARDAMADAGAALRGAFGAG